jgi:hypothetical protein
MAVSSEKKIRVGQIFEWEIEYVDLEACMMALRLNHGTRRRIPTPIFDTGEQFGWEVGDLHRLPPPPPTKKYSSHRTAGPASLFHLD